MKLRLPEHIRNLSDEQWLQLLIKSTSSQIVEGIQFPGFPSENIQKTYVGCANETALREAFIIYKLLKQSALKANHPLTRGSRFLDFGCGWGRCLRFFWKDIDEELLFGCDVAGWIVELCRSLNVPGQFDPIHPQGTLPHPDNYFDAILANSVFTHLPENTHLHWMQELARVARPGCIFCLTIEPRRFIDYIGEIPSDTDNTWFKLLSVFKPRLAEFHRTYDSGNVVFLPTCKSVEAAYGDAIVPLSFIKQKWSPYFKLLTHIDDPEQFNQAVLVVQRL